MTRRGLAAVADDLLDLRAHSLEGDAERLERFGRDAFTLVDQPEQDVLGPDVIVVEESRFFLREDHDPSCSVGEALEQDDPPLVRFPMPEGSAGLVPILSAVSHHFFGDSRRPQLPGPGRGDVPADQLSTGESRTSPAQRRGASRRASAHAGASRRPAGAALASARSGLRPWGALRGRSEATLTSHLLDEVGLAPLSLDLGRVEVRLREAVSADDRFLGEAAGHLLAAGGKRLRPTLTFCAAYAATGIDRRGHGGGASDDVITGGAAVELVHLGSLYHDDVIDEAETRRGVPSVNARWSNIVAILAGDYLLAQASSLAASLGADVAALLAATIGELCRGQVLELQYLFDTDRTEDSYLSAIEGKTASLMATACRVGGMVSNVSADTLDALTQFGQHLGMCFQIVDDVLDVTRTEAELGKPVGNDVLEGVYTLPVIYALQTEARSELVSAPRPQARARRCGTRRSRSSPGPTWWTPRWRSAAHARDQGHRSPGRRDRARRRRVRPHAHTRGRTRSSGRRRRDWCLLARRMGRRVCRRDHDGDARGVRPRRVEAWLAEDIDAYLGCWHDDMRIEMPTGVIEGAAPLPQARGRELRLGGAGARSPCTTWRSTVRRHRVRRLDDPRPPPRRRRAHGMARAVGVRATRRPDQLVARASPRRRRLRCRADHAAGRVGRQPESSSTASMKRNTASLNASVSRP